MGIATDLSRLLLPPVCEGRVQVALLCPPRGRDAGGRGQVVLRLPVPHTHQGEHHAQSISCGFRKMKSWTRSRLQDVDYVFLSEEEYF